ncbi:MAG: hypothetical protein AABX51_07320 [Nanoarchaeota archaeon]
MKNILTDFIFDIRGAILLAFIVAVGILTLQALANSTTSPEAKKVAENGVTALSIVGEAGAPDATDVLFLILKIFLGILTILGLATGTILGGKWVFDRINIEQE